MRACVCHFFMQKTGKSKEKCIFFYFFAKKFGQFKKKAVLLHPLSRESDDLLEINKEKNAEIAQLVEHNLAKVGVASSSLVFRSFFLPRWRNW